MPRVLLACPTGRRREPVEDFGFEETPTDTGRKYAWMNAAYAMAANINRAFKEYGWCAQASAACNPAAKSKNCRRTHSRPTMAASI